MPSCYLAENQQAVQYSFVSPLFMACGNMCLILSEMGRYSEHVVSISNPRQLLGNIKHLSEGGIKTPRH